MGGSPHTRGVSVKYVTHIVHNVIHEAGGGGADEAVSLLCLTGIGLLYALYGFDNFT